MGPGFVETTPGKPEGGASALPVSNGRDDPAVVVRGFQRMWKGEMVGRSSRWRKKVNRADQAESALPFLKWARREAPYRARMAGAGRARTGRSRRAVGCTAASFASSWR